MSMSADKTEFATKEDIETLGRQIDECFKSSDENKALTKKDLKISLLEFAKEYKLDWMNTKINFLLWIVGAGIPAVFGYLLYRIDGIYTILFQIVEKFPK